MIFYDFPGDGQGTSIYLEKPPSPQPNNFTSTEAYVFLLICLTTKQAEGEKGAEGQMFTLWWTKDLENWIPNPKIY